MVREAVALASAGLIAVSYDNSNTFANVVSYTFLGAGGYDDLGRYINGAPGLLGTSWRSGSTNLLILTPASGGSTINGLDASGVDSGFTLVIQNPSSTDNLIFAHEAGTSLSTNQFSNVQAGSVALLPLGAARCTYIINKWQFA